MKRFVFSAFEEAEAYEAELSDGLCHVFEDCLLPPGCKPSKARLGFEKRDGEVILYIDKGISCLGGGEDFGSFLAAGEARFTGMRALHRFLCSLRPLYEKEDPVDRVELERLQEEAKKKPMVWPEEIASRLAEHIFGQEEVLDELAERIVINRLAASPSLLTLGLIGPTATGKSETGRLLAGLLTELYGEEMGFIEVAGSEFLSPHSVHRFFGAPPGYVGHGEATLLEPLRKKPHVVVINEIEKADKALITGLMEAIDTGRLGMADNSPDIPLQGSILLFTSNLPVDMEYYLSLGSFARGEYCRDVFTAHCSRPEISGKIGAFLVYRPLSAAAKTDIIIKFIRKSLEDFGMELGQISTPLMLDFHRCESRYGARGIRETVQSALGRRLLKSRELERFRGKRLSLSGSVEEIIFTAQEENL